MSTPSAYVDELRAMAESVGLAMPQAATLMMEAADTILDLVDERERLFRANVEKNGEMLRLVGENAKLRELVKEMRVCLKDECKRCHEWGDICDLEHQMRELVVAVDD